MGVIAECLPVNMQITLPKINRSPSHRYARYSLYIMELMDLLTLQCLFHSYIIFPFTNYKVQRGVYNSDYRKVRPFLNVNSCLHALIFALKLGK